MGIEREQQIRKKKKRVERERERERETAHMYRGELREIIKKN